MIERNLRVTGEVQKVGYRDRVQDLAIDYVIVGSVKNLPDRSVEIICQGKKEDVVEFTYAIEIREEYINVDEIIVVEEKEINSLTSDQFRIKFGEFAEEFGERMIEGFRYIKDTKEEVINVGRKVDEIGCKIDKGFEEQGEKLDEIGCNINKGFKEQGEKLDEIGCNINKGFKGQGKKLDTIGFEINTLTHLTDENFHRLDSKYHQIAERTSSVDDRMKDMVDEIKSIADNIDIIVKEFVDMRS